MKELQTILRKLRQISSENTGAVLATVVDVRGSSYRLPGARMLILESGEAVGTVSGGCLEADVTERAKQVLKTGEPQVFVYDMTATEDSVFSLNMGCRGVIRILLETASAENNFVQFLETRLRQRKGGVAATLISAPEGFKHKTGARIVFDESGIATSDFDAHSIEQLLPAVQKAFADRRSFFQTHDSAEFFIEYIAPPISLVVFGAGADAVPLVRFAEDLGWHSTIVDHRAAVATKERFPAANEIVVARPENLPEDLFSAEQTAAVVMTHNYERDKEILRRLLQLAAPLLYVGALGSKRRTENILDELARENEKFSTERLKTLHAPVGLDIGADAPEGIALSIVAEIQSVLSNRAGGFLRNRNGSIYGRAES